MLTVLLLPSALGSYYMFEVATLPDYVGISSEYENQATSVIESGTFSLRLYRGPFETFIQDLDAEPLVLAGLESQMPEPIAEYLYSLLPSEFHLSIIRFNAPRRLNYIGILPYDSNVSGVQKVELRAIVYARYESELTGLTVPLYVFVIDHLDDANLLEAVAYFTGHALNFPYLFLGLAGLLGLIWLIFTSAIVFGAIRGQRWRVSSGRVGHPRVMGVRTEQIQTIGVRERTQERRPKVLRVRQRGEQD